MAPKVYGNFIVDSTVAQAYEGELKVMVTVGTERLTQRAPIDFVAVLDVSGSMSMAAGPSATKPSRLDLMKKSMKYIISQLHDDDGLAIVAFNDKLVTDEYNSQIVRFSSEGGRRSAEMKVHELVANGDTAFKSGLDQALKILDLRADKNRLGFIILLSDGLDNSDTKWDNDIMATDDPFRNNLKRYPVHTFGIGTGHDPTALYFIARESQGIYSFIEESFDKITDAFAILLGGLSNVVASNVEVKISRTTDAVVKRVDSGGYKNMINSPGASIYINHLYACEMKRFMAYISVPAGGKEKFILELEAIYKDAASGQNVRQWLCSFPISRSHTQVLAGSSDRLLLNEQMSVIYGVGCLESQVESVLKGLKNIALIKKEKGDEAKMAIDEQNRAADQLARVWGSAKTSSNNFPSPLDSSFVQDLDKDIEAMLSSLRRGSGPAHFYSWMSSYQMQRATIMGSPEKVVARYLTPAMKAMVVEAQKHHADEDEAAADQGAVSTDNGDVLPVPQGKYIADLHWIDARMKVWDKLKSELGHLLQPPPPSSSSKADRTESQVREALAEGINRAMHQDIYQAVVHAINQAGKQPYGDARSVTEADSTKEEETPPEATTGDEPNDDVPTPKGDDVATDQPEDDDV